MAALSVCALVLAGCDTLNESAKSFNESVSEVDSLLFGDGDAPEASEGTAEPVTSEPGEELALDPALIAKVQTRLTELGYQPGPVDGAMGPKTRAAVRRYQVVIGLPVDGRITEPFLARLNSPDNTPVEKAAAAESQTESEPKAEPQAEAKTAAAKKVPAAATTASPSGPLPSYSVGDRYVYEGGDVWTVLAVDGQQVYWESSLHGQAVAHSNFLVPELSWVAAETSGKREIDAAPEALWLSQAGTEISFTAGVTVEPRNRPGSRSQLTETWTCQVAEKERLKVRAGTFRTQEMTCEGRSEPGGQELTRVWHFAPQIDHYVLFEEFGADGEPRQRRELLAVVPSTGGWPPVAQAGLGWALAHALETAAPGEETTWSSSAVETEVTIKTGAAAAPGLAPAAESDDEVSCRNFMQIWSAGEGKRVYPGLSCRDGAGQWGIPGVEDGLELAKTPE